MNPPRGPVRTRLHMLAGALALLAVVGSTFAYAAFRAGSLGASASASGFALSLDDPGIERFSQRKRYVPVGPWEVALIDEGQGDPLVLLHGCPFHAYEWKDVIPALSAEYRVIAPDLLGLGDTRVRLDQDYRLPRDVEMVVGLLDALGIDKAHIVGHDHGGATLQIMMKHHPARIRSAVLTNAEAYDQWPSEPERPYLELVVHPLLSPVFRWALESSWAQREVFSVAVHDEDTFTDEVLAAYTRAHIATPERWQRLVRFFQWQLDRDHNREPLRALDGMRRFTAPTLLLWGKQDTNFGPALAERLASDIPGVRRIEWLEQSAHMPMQEEPEAYATALLRFLAEVEAEEQANLGEATRRGEAR